MSEYTLTCPDCDECRRSFPPPVPAGSLCARCCSLESLLGDYLKSRAGRLRVHAMLMQAEIAAGCAASCRSLVVTPGTTRFVNPPSLDQSDRFQA